MTQVTLLAQRSLGRRNCPLPQPGEAPTQGVTVTRVGADVSSFLWNAIVGVRRVHPHQEAGAATRIATAQRLRGCCQRIWHLLRFIGVLGQAGELAGEGRLALLARYEAAFGLATALVGLTELATTCGTYRLGPALYPESPSAALAALGAIAADIEDVLPRSCRSAPSNVALQGVASRADRRVVTRSLHSRPPALSPGRVCSPSTCLPRRAGG